MNNYYIGSREYIIFELTRKILPSYYIFGERPSYQEKVFAHINKASPKRLRAEEVIDDEVKEKKFKNRT